MLPLPRTPPTVPWGGGMQRDKGVMEAACLGSALFPFLEPQGSFSEPFRMQYLGPLVPYKHVGK